MWIERSGHFISLAVQHWHQNFFVAQNYPKKQSHRQTVGGNYQVTIIRWCRNDSTFLSNITLLIFKRIHILTVLQLISKNKTISHQTSLLIRGQSKLYHVVEQALDTLAYNTWTLTDVRLVSCDSHTARSSFPLSSLSANFLLERLQKAHHWVTTLETKSADSS